MSYKNHSLHIKQIHGDVNYVHNTPYQIINYKQCMINYALQCHDVDIGKLLQQLKKKTGNYSYF